MKRASARRRGWTLGLSFCAALLASAQAPSPSTYRQKTRTFHTPDEFSRLSGGNVTIHRGRDAGREEALRRNLTPLPSGEITVVAAESPSVTWVGTRAGAVRIADGQAREYFSGLRWLPDDGITGIGFGGGAAWIETSKGFSRIEYKPLTLVEKSRGFVARVQTRHNRWGLTADSHLRVPGDLSSNQMVSSDNDGLWTAMYVAAECFRFRVTGEADARENARRGMAAIMRLEAITGIPGVPARSFIQVGDDQQPQDGEWHDTADKAWRWKGDTSSDEIVGHFFVYPLYPDLVASDDEKPALRAVIDRMATHIIDNGYQLIDVDGKRTRWGWWGPEAIWQDPDETGLRALHILAHLRVAIHLAGSPQARTKYPAAYDRLVKEHRYHLLTRNQKIMVPGSINHSDDELAFLSYYPLLQYEKDPALVAVYRQSLERSWQVERAERNPLWNVIYAAGTAAKEFDRAESLRTLQEIPMDQIKWAVSNSHRQDVPIDPLSDRFKRRQALIVLPYDELPMSK